MIDFVSSNPSADPQTVACARLIAAVIAQAIDDASSKTCTEAENFSAINWLFDKSSTFEEYARLIGADAGAMRKALLAPPGNTSPRYSKFDPMKRRHLKMSHANWLKRHERVNP